jgi:hypothetical protein
MKKKTSKKPNTKTILDNFLASGFFDEWRTVSEVIKRLSNKGFTVKGKQISAISKMLTQMCQNLENKLEREEIPKEKRIGQERWMFKRC